MMVPGLTHRECQVLQMVRDGLSNHAIAKLLAVGERTVKRHVERLMDFSGMSTRWELIAKYATGAHGETEQLRSENLRLTAELARANAIVDRLLRA